MAERRAAARRRAAVLGKAPEVKPARLSPPRSDGAKLPDIEYIREKLLLEVLSVSRATLWRMVHRGDFPEAKRVSTRRKAWLVADVRAWQERLHGGTSRARQQR